MQVLREFLKTQEEMFLKSKIKTNMTEEQKAEIVKTAKEKCSFEQWVPDAAKRAGWLFMTTHPPKFSHPDAKTNAVYAVAKNSDDGFLRSGNCAHEPDVYGNAAAQDVFRFLSLQMEDGKTLLDHIENETETAKALAERSHMDFQDLKNGFLSVKSSGDTLFTSGKVKQVYYPCNGDYHLLSILTPSGIVFEMRKRIDAMHFSQDAKDARQMRRNGEFCQSGFDDFYGLTVIGYGGSKPQNISRLNSSYRGRAYLLPSLPPKLEKSGQRLPLYDFFKNCLWIKSFKPHFDALHNLFITDYNNINIRKSISNIILDIQDQVIYTAWSIRRAPSGWSQAQRFSALPMAQKIWLDDAYKEKRETMKDEWQPAVIGQLARWILFAYKNIKENQSVLLGDNELAHFRKLIEENSEALL